MPSFFVPISWSVYDPDPTGPIRRAFRARVAAEVWVQPGRWKSVPNFVVDTGASATIVSAEWARGQRIALPEESSAVPVVTAAGSVRATVRDGELRLRFTQLPGHVFRLYCVFSESMPASTPPLLGLNDFLDVFRLTFDGAARPDAAMGGIRFETTA